MVKWINRMLERKQPTHEQTMIEEANLLEQSILARQLNIIDAQFKVQAEDAKRSHIITWLQSRKPITISESQHDIIG